MPVITVTSVNTGTEELTATAHGLVTGDRFRLRNVGGALPAATPSLAGVTDYFAIRTGADTLKVAVSSSDAQAGTAVNITGAGTGTHLIEYGLPYCVPRIAAAGGQIFSADDNSAWNALVALHALMTGQAQTIWTGGQGDRVMTFAGAMMTPTLATDGTDYTAHGGIESNALANWVLSIPLCVGDRIKSVTFAAIGNGTVDGNYSVADVDSVDGTTSLGSGTLTNVPATWGDFTLNVTDTVLATGHVFVLTIGAAAAGLIVNSIRVTYDRP